MSTEETKVAVMQKEISYISKQVDTILLKLEENVRLHEAQMNRLQTEMDKRFDGVHTRIDTKADQAEVDKINSVLSRINWIIITAVLGALLALIINSQ